MSPAPPDEPAILTRAPPSGPSRTGGASGAEADLQAVISLGAAAPGSATFVRVSAVPQAAREDPLAVSVESVTVLVYWWGYELALPPRALATLERARSVQQTFFWFLQGFILAGGAPELAPFVRYISSFLDLEWSAIKAQNKGNGVVLGATWLVPVALVPRPWDFAMPDIVAPP
ncbi:hypothetical protein JCM3774_004407 [Rhodotorula dairenensis]